ncbi:MAG: ABC transporter ATP-binding protein [Candidatus Eiseniibacteriota bacterium]
MTKPPVDELPALQLDHVSIVFGGLKAVSDLVLDVRPGELVGLIGPNGAGKTTVFNLITGVYAPTSGTIRFGDTVLNGLRPNRICSLGIARTFQNTRLFAGLSVLDNVRIGAHVHAHSAYLEGALDLPRSRAEERRIDERAHELLDVLSLTDVTESRAADLPYGRQRRLEIARALATEPKLLLLDEPAAGMNPQETDALMHLIEEVRKRFQLAVLLIEHDMRVVMTICHRIAVLDYGVKIAEGDAEYVRRDPATIRAYLGDEVA